MFRIIIKTVPQSRLFDPMPMPRKRRNFNNFSRLKINLETHPFIRRISKIAN
jgi:hypothetical protein